MGPPSEKRQAEEPLGNWRTGEDWMEVLVPPHFTLVSSYLKTLGSLLSLSFIMGDLKSFLEKAQFK